MPVITDPGEPYFKDGIWGWDAAADLWIPLAADPATNYLIVNARGDIEVHQHTPADMQVAAHGWDGAAWHHLPMVWGYSAVYSERVNAPNVAAGNYTIDFGTVPAGEVWVVTHMSVWTDTVGPTHIQFQPFIDGQYIVVSYQDFADVLHTVEFASTLYLRVNDFLSFQFIACVLNADVFARAAGYKMLIAE